MYVKLQNIRFSRLRGKLLFCLDVGDKVDPDCRPRRSLIRHCAACYDNVRGVVEYIPSRRRRDIEPAWMRRGKNKCRIHASDLVTPIVISGRTRIHATGVAATNGDLIRVCPQGYLIYFVTKECGFPIPRIRRRSDAWTRSLVTVRAANNSYLNCRTTENWPSPA